jgi:hypothetical protein
MLAIIIVFGGFKMKLECKCGHVWDYKGKKKRYAVCPDCRKLVIIEKAK